MSSCSVGESEREVDLLQRQRLELRPGEPLHQKERETTGYEVLRAAHIVVAGEGGACSQPAGEIE